MDQDRNGESIFNFENYALKWTFANEFDLIFVVVYQKILILSYLEELLEAIKRKFIEAHSGQIKEYYRYDFHDFDETFERTLSKLETSVRQAKEKPKGPRTFSETVQGKKTTGKKGLWILICFFFFL